MGQQPLVEQLEQSVFPNHGADGVVLHGVFRPHSMLDKCDRILPERNAM
jgi:hypothetical protein